MKRPRAAAPRDVDGAGFLAWLDAPAAAGCAPVLCVGELHFSNAAHMPDGTPVEQLYGVLFQLRRREDGSWTHEGGFPWRVVPMACTVLAELGAPADDGTAWQVTNTLQMEQRLNDMEEFADAEYAPQELPTAAAVVGAPRLPLRRAGWHADARAARSGPRRVAGVRREAQRLGLEPRPRGGAHERRGARPAAPRCQPALT